jgi:hypothetical protein
MTDEKSSEVSKEILELVDKAINTFQHPVSPYSFYRTLSLLVGGKFYGKAAITLGDKEQQKNFQTAVRYYLSAAESVPQIQSKDISVETGDFDQTVFSQLDYFFQAMKDVYWNRTAKYTLPSANVLECSEIIRSEILMELAELYAETNRRDEAINIYEGLVGRLSVSSLNQSIIYTQILLNLSQEQFKDEEFGKTADIASEALSKIALQHNIQNELLADEQAQLLNLIDDLSKHNDSVIRNKENQGYYQTVENNLRRLCSANKTKPQNCDRFNPKDNTNLYN